MTRTLVNNASFRSENRSTREALQPDLVYQARVFNPSSNEYVFLQLQRNDSGDAVQFSIDRLSFFCRLSSVQPFDGANCSSHHSITEFRGTVNNSSGRQTRITIIVDCGAKPESLSIDAEGLGKPEQLFWEITHDIQTGVIDFLTGC